LTFDISGDIIMYNQELRIKMFKIFPKKEKEALQDVNIKPEEEADIPVDIEEDEIGNDIDLA